MFSDAAGSHLGGSFQRGKQNNSLNNLIVHVILEPRGDPNHLALVIGGE
jgi:hypothetical protein